METQEKESTLIEYLKGIGLDLEVAYDYNENAPEWAKDKNHYYITLRKDSEEMSLWFYQGTALDEPTLDRVIECLASDRSCAQMSLDEFGDEFGWDKNTTRTHRHLVAQNEDYERLIGNDLLLDEIYEKVTE